MKKRQKKAKYLTIHVRPSEKLLHTVTVSVPVKYYFAEALGDVVKKAIEHVQRTTPDQRQ